MTHPLARPWRTALALAACLLGSTSLRAETTAPPPSYDGKMELGVFIPFSIYDSDFPVRDLMGEDDEIRNAFGRGIELAYNFSPSHAIETNNSWIDSDSEDRRGDNHFSIRTRYNLLTYRFTFYCTPRWAGFVMAGAGAFRARAMEEDHVSFGGRVLTAGAGVRLYTSHRSSMFLMVEGARVNLFPTDANNIVIAWGITSHFGKGPGQFEPPSKTDGGE